MLDLSNFRAVVGRFRRDRRGGVFVLISFSFLVLIGAAALAVDKGNAYSGDPNCVYQSPHPKTLNGQLLATFNVMSANVYGQWTDSEEECEERLQAVGEYLDTANYDFVGMQEVHPDWIIGDSCDGSILIDELSLPNNPTGPENAPEGFVWDHYRWQHPKAFKQANGGLAFYSQSPVLFEEYDESDFSGPSLNGLHPAPEPVLTENVIQVYDEDGDVFATLGNGIRDQRSAHGILFARVWLDYPDIAVDTYVVHLFWKGKYADTRCDSACRVAEAAQLRVAIHERSADSGFPVLVMGDFNLGGPNPDMATCEGHDGYDAFIESLGNPMDVWLEAHPQGNGETHSDERIDMMFIPDDPYLVNSEYKLVIPDSTSIRIQDWSVLGIGPIPDHSGLEADLELRKKLSYAAVVAAVL